MTLFLSIIHTRGRQISNSVSLLFWSLFIVSALITVPISAWAQQPRIPLEREPQEETDNTRWQDSLEQSGTGEFILSAGSSVVTKSSGTSLQNEILYHYTEQFSASILIGYTRLHNNLENRALIYSNQDPAQVDDQALHYSLVSLNLNMYFTPLRKWGHRVMVGGGLGYFVQNRTRIEVRQLPNETSTFLSDRNDRGLGFQLSTRYSYRFTPHISGGLSGHVFFFDENVGNLSLSLLYHL
jgi:hypothetical protein